jgi:hypothetical protein
MRADAISKSETLHFDSFYFETVRVNVLFASRHTKLLTAKRELT